MDVIDFISEKFSEGDVLFSLMSQYTPMPGLERFPELQRRITQDTNSLLIEYMENSGITDGYWQEVEAATTEMIPDFDGTGVE